MMFIGVEKAFVFVIARRWGILGSFGSRVAHTSHCQKLIAESKQDTSTLSHRPSGVTSTTKLPPGEVIHIESGETVVLTLSVATETSKVEDGFVYVGTCIVRHSEWRVANGAMDRPPASILQIRAVMNNSTNTLKTKDFHTSISYLYDIQ